MDQIFLLFVIPVAVTFCMCKYIIPVCLKKVPISVRIFPTVNIVLPIAIFVSLFVTLYYILNRYNSYVVPLAELQRIEQMQANAQVTLVSVNGRVAGIDKLSKPPGASYSQLQDSVKTAGTELDGVLQYLKQSSEAIYRNESSFGGDTITFVDEMIQRWQKLKERQAQLAKHAEELRIKLKSYPLAELQRIEQMQANAQVTLVSVNGRVAGIDKLSKPPGASYSQLQDSVKTAGTELDGVLQYLKQSSEAIYRNESSFGGGTITFGDEMIQRWQKLKERQAQLAKHAEELRIKLTSYPLPEEKPPKTKPLPAEVSEPPKLLPATTQDSEQNLRNTACEFVTKYYQNLHKADVRAVSEMWIPERIPNRLPDMVRNCCLAEIKCTQVIEINSSNAKIRVDATVKSQGSMNSRRYILTFDLRRSGEEWKLYRQIDSIEVDTKNPSCLADRS